VHTGSRLIAQALAPDHCQAKGNRAMTLNLQRAASELAEKIAALPARYPYIGAAEKHVYLFAPTESERDLIVQALCALAAARNRSA
jgi:hypothetical protein